MLLNTYFRTGIEGCIMNKRYGLGALLLLTAVVLFLPVRDNYLLYLLLAGLSGWIASVYARFPEQIPGAFWFVPGLTLAGLVSLLLNTGSVSWLNGFIFLGVVFLPISVFFGMDQLRRNGWTSGPFTWLFSAVFLVQVPIAVYQFFGTLTPSSMNWCQDCIRGTMVNQNYLSLFCLLGLVWFLHLLISSSNTWFRVVCGGGVFCNILLLGLAEYKALIIGGLLAVPAAIVLLAFLYVTCGWRWRTFPLLAPGLMILALLLATLPFANRYTRIPGQVERVVSRVVPPESPDVQHVPDRQITSSIPDGLGTAGGGQREGIMARNRRKPETYDILDVPRTNGLSAGEIRSLMHEVDPVKLYFAGWLESVTSLWKRGPTVVLFGHGMGNVNSRAANLRNRPWRVGWSVPLFSPYKNRAMEYHVLRWTNETTREELPVISGTVLVQPFASMKVFWLELGLAGVLIVLGWFGFLLRRSVRLQRAEVESRQTTANGLFFRTFLLFALLAVMLVNNVFEIGQQMVLFWIFFELFSLDPDEVRDETESR